MPKSADRSAERAARTQALLDQQRKGERRRQLLITGAVAAVLAIVIGIGVWVQSSRDTTGDIPDAVPTGVTDDYGILVGEADAPVTISIYEDLQCPICAQLEATVGEQLDEAIDDGRVQVEYRMVAFLDSQSENEYSTRALNALLATHDTAGVDAFRTLHRELYADQPAEGTAGPEDDELVAAAVAAGAPDADVRPLVEDRAYAQWITNATDAMSQNDVNGTPTVFIDGERAEGDPAQAVLDAIDG